MAKRRTRGEGTIFYSDAEGCWIAEVVLPDGKARRKRSKKQAVVREWLQISLSELRQGTFIESTSLTLSAFLDRYLSDVAERTLRPKTIESYRYLIEKHIKPSIGHLKMVQIKPAHLQALYSKKLDEGLSRRTVHYIHSVLHRAFSQAVKWELLVRNPSDAVTAPRPVKRAPEMLTLDQIKLFLEAVKDHRFYPIYLIAIGCGLREGEILALEARDISLERKVLQVRRTVVNINGYLSFGEPKSEKSKRSVAIPDFVIDALKDRMPQEGLIFRVSSGRPISPRNLLRHFQDNLEKLGMPRVHFHSLRHSYASLQLLNGTNPKVVQEALGHSTITLTLDTYSHIIPTLQQEAAQKMDAIFKQ